MKVANITLHAINNYGSVFQSVATERIFESLGCDVETIDYIRETAQLDSLWKILKYGGPGFIIKIKQIILYFMPNSKGGRTNQLDRFRSKYLHLSKRSYRSDEDLEKYIPEADIYCTGSDQTWNTEIQHGVPYAFFLGFVPNDKKCISFASSFGVSKLQESFKGEIKELLSRYSAISVRDLSGKIILNDLGFEESVQVLDPTLVINPNYWYSISSARIIGNDYILVYQLNSSKKFVDFVNTFARLKGLQVVHVRTRKEQIDNCVFMPDCSPEDLLSLFRYSTYVITDSFHATAFSLIFHCNFMDIFPCKYSSRIESVLELTGLQNRHVVDFDRYDYADVPIDYVMVDAVLSSERGKSIAFLQNAIKK